MEIYLDNSATTRPYKEVAETVADVMFNAYGNPSSLHRLGVEAEALIKQSRERIAATIKADPREIFFTSGGTESNNLAIMGVCRAGRGRHPVCFGAGGSQGGPPFATRLCLQSVVCYTCWRG